MVRRPRGPGYPLIVSAGITPSPARPQASSLAVFCTGIVASSCHILHGRMTQTQTVTVPQPVISLNVQSYGWPIEVTAAPVTHVQITETIVYYGRPPSGLQSVSGGRLFLADPSCVNGPCLVGFAVRVPRGHRHRGGRLPPRLVLGADAG